jgi:large subunit ribosomal protein L19
MPLSTVIKETTFGVGDVVRVYQVLTDKSESEKGSRTQSFEGTVIAIRGTGMGKSFIVRRIGEHKIGIEQIFPINSPLIDKVEVVRSGKRGVRQGKLYYIRDKSNREIEKIYTRARRRELSKMQKPKAPKAKKAVKKVVKKTAKKSSKKK